MVLTLSAEDLIIIFCSSLLQEFSAFNLYSLKFQCGASTARFFLAPSALTVDTPTFTITSSFDSFNLSMALVGIESSLNSTL